MTYRATLDGEFIGQGSIQQVRAAVAEAVTGLVAQDPMGAAQGAQTVNLAFSEGAVEAALEEGGAWKTIIGVNGEPVRLHISKEE